MYLDIHSHTQHSTIDTLVIRNQYPLTADTTEPFSVGIHPWYIDNWELQWEALVPLAKHHNCWAIGECGLDKNITTPLPLQQEIFLKHIQLAETLELPLIIHCVKAYSEVIHLRKITKSKQLWILHGFRKNLKIAHECIAHGIALPYSTHLNYRKFSKISHQNTASLNPMIIKYQYLRSSINFLISNSQICKLEN